MKEKPRISTAQLKHLMNAFPVATSESPLVFMYREMLTDALLDLRDAIGEQARLQWYVTRQDAGIKQAKKIALDIACARRISDDDYNYLNATLEWADEHPVGDPAKEAIAPLTGKEKL